MSTTNTHERGFTLVEMIVAVALFAVVMMVAVGALLSLTAANRKAQALQSVMNNLDIALDGMVRNIRMGTQYHCGPGGFQAASSDDCPSNPGIEFSFTCNPDTDSCGTSGRWTYLFDTTGTGTYCGVHALCRQEGSSGQWEAITAPEVTIDSMAFYVVGAEPGFDSDNSNIPEQPKVVIVVKGEAGTGSAQTQTTFHIEATAVQRQLDLKPTP